MKFLDLINKNLFFHELTHFILSLLSGLFVWLIFGDWRLMPIAFLFGFFIDVDHLFDYLNWSRGSFKLSEFFTPRLYVRGSKKVFVPFHGWEFLPLIWIVGRAIGLRLGISGFQWAASLAYFTHMVWDQITVNSNTLGYFFIYRLINKFKIESFNGKK